MCRLSDYIIDEIKECMEAQRKHECKTFLELLVPFLHTLNDFKNERDYGYLLANGKIHTPLNKTLSRRLRGQYQCIQNYCFPYCQWIATEHPEYKYCEGIARNGSHYYREHAYLLDEKGRVVDPTYKGGCDEYFGTVVPKSKILTHNRNGRNGSILLTEFDSDRNRTLCLPNMSIR